MGFYSFNAAGAQERSAPFKQPPLASFPMIDACFGIRSAHRDLILVIIENFLGAGQTFVLGQDAEHR